MSRSDIKQALKNDLGTLATVHDSLPYIDKVKEFPSYAISSDAEKITMLPSGVLQRKAVFNVVGYFHATKGDYETQQEQAYEDIINLFDENCETFQIKEVESLEVNGIEPYPEIDGKGFIIIPITITYY